MLCLLSFESLSSADRRSFLICAVDDSGKDGGPHFTQGMIRICSLERIAHGALLKKVSATLSRGLPVRIATKIYDRGIKS